MRWVTLALVMCSLVAVPTARAADPIGSATALSLNTSFSENAAGFTVEAGEQNTTTPFAQTCDSGHNVGVARTGWYTIQGTGGPISVTTENSSFDTALFVYSGAASGNLVGCSDDAGGGIQSIVEFGSTSGTTYFLQVGVACNEAAPSQCSQSPPAGNITIRANGQASSPPPNNGGGQPPPASAGQPAATDADRDGSPAGADCNDANPAIHPGAGDVPHNKVDEDCNGADAAFPRLGSTPSTTVIFGRGFTRFTKLNVAGAPAGATIAVSCSSKKKGCPFTSRTLPVASAKTVSLGKLLKKAKLRTKAVLTVRVTRPGYVGNVFTFTMRNRKAPTRTTLCLLPGAAKPQASCA